MSPRFLPWIKTLFASPSHPTQRNSRRAFRTIESLEDRLAFSVSYATIKDWGDGLEGKIKITNDQTAVIQGWRVEFDYARTIDKMWDGVMVSHVGNHYVMQNASYNSTIAVGQTISFGFTAGAGSEHAAKHDAQRQRHSTPPTPPGITIGDVTVTEGNPTTAAGQWLLPYLGQSDSRRQQPGGADRRRQLVRLRDQQLRAARPVDARLQVDDGSDEATRLQHHPPAVLRISCSTPAARPTASTSRRIPICKG